MELVKLMESAQAVSVCNAKTGMEGKRLMTRAEYRKHYGLGRSDAERRHVAYLLENGVKANQNVASQIAGGKLLITGIKEYERSGKGTISFIRSEKVVVKEGKSDKVVAAELTEEQLLQLLEAKRNGKN